jgi:hypothetical protein
MFILLGCLNFVIICANNSAHIFCAANKFYRMATHGSRTAPFSICIMMTVCLSGTETRKQYVYRVVSFEGPRDLMTCSGTAMKKEDGCTLEDIGTLT